MEAKITIATPETDDELREKYFKQGADDFNNSAKNEELYNRNSMVSEWYKEGWDFAKNYLVVGNG
jgi:hypothetical protein